MNTYTEEVLTFMQVVSSAGIERACVVEMVEVGLVDPIGADVEAWQFAASDFKRICAAQRLMSDLGVNVAGAAMILDLIAERDALLSQVQVLRRLLEE